MLLISSSIQIWISQLLSIAHCITCFPSNYDGHASLDSCRALQFCHLGNCDHAVVSVDISFCSLIRQEPPINTKSICYIYIYKTHENVTLLKFIPLTFTREKFFFLPLLLVQLGAYLQQYITSVPKLVLMSEVHKSTTGAHELSKFLFFFSLYIRIFYSLCWCFLQSGRMRYTMFLTKISFLVVLVIYLKK